LRPVSFERGADDGIAEALAASTPLRIRRSSLWFHGGYVAVGDHFILVGRDCVEATLTMRAERGAPAPPPDADPDAYVAALFEEELDPRRKVILVGTDRPVPQRTARSVVVDGRERLEIVNEAAGRAQPLFHIDLFLSLAGRGPSGRYRILVGSPGLADRMLGRATVDHGMDALFDDIAEQLADEGFEVVRNPLPLTYADGEREIDGQTRSVRVWYFATSNNCLVQIDEDAGNQVWLPSYGHRGWSDLAATDAENERIWQSLGFNVRTLPSFHAFAQRSGALGCITKVLER
ncbi:MAG TPA: hypothetical protein VEA19_00690, partial [Actinomycetota bacterium]|nr:hypothetical protein [Actinomycetota bacterium]